MQDTNEPQYALSRLLKGNNNLFVVGDPDQAVYRWAHTYVWVQGGRPPGLVFLLL